MYQKIINETNVNIVTLFYGEIQINITLLLYTYSTEIFFQFF